jgi:hypothetical protein
VSTPRFIHDAVNTYFRKHFGYPFRNGMFGTGDRHTIGQYGNMYYVFPQGDFTYLWSEDINDMFNSITTQALSNSENTAQEFIDKVIAPANWHTDNLQAGIDSDNEIMIICDRYYGISYNMKSTDKEGMLEIIEL